MTWVEQNLHSLGGRWYMLKTLCSGHNNRQVLACVSEMKGCNIKPTDKRHCNKNTSKRRRVTAAGSTSLTCLAEKGREVEKERQDIMYQLFWVTAWRPASLSMILSCKRLNKLQCQQRGGLFCEYCILTISAMEPTAHKMLISLFSV